MSAEIKPGQVWAWNDPAGWSGPELTIVPVPEESRPDNRPAYVYEEDEERTVWRITDDMLRRVAHLVKDVDATPTPLDPSRVKAGDTVTLRVGAGDLPTLTIAGLTHKTINGVYLGGWRINRLPDYVTLTAHQPAPEPEPEWKPGTVGTATIRDVKGVRGVWATLWGGEPYFAILEADKSGTGSLSSTAEHVTDFVPDEPHPLPTREQIAVAIARADSHESQSNLYLKNADAVLALLRGESR